jgi:hypothetical protein
MKRRAAIILAGMLAVGAVVAGAPAASAAAPRCTGAGWRIYIAPDGTAYHNLLIFFPAHSPDVRIPGGQGGGYWSCSLVQGSTGEGVRELQQNLNYCYGDVIGAPLEQDGQFGPLTKAALVEVQRFHRIEANGQYGPQTARTIEHPKFTGWGGCITLSDFGWPGNSG